jgi:hypothetical protein
MHHISFLIISDEYSLARRITQRFIQPFSTEFLEIAVFEEVILLHRFFLQI